ncbi:MULTISPECIES: DUF6434 domain-containing protein [Eubacteriales]|uniref:SAP domain-containing protein n=1 Tax=Bittarella massiliensis (ex Durand et al. 2017) TaxID=1720313 RepID=A0AAQ1MDW5_9FIRM|nr:MULTISPECIES: DUF6434 domain-containing protein [Eubacteriales]ERJ00814.1 hypothetical protein HMPREF0262_00486 [Clostridium sp. ATCC 29733]MZL70347.1 hypothetical protein [Bittarella massiliensis (ex Durand et al. 2017)]MZL80887.1 hypothetical protein [Bittarella massiliensis (ex Durand et al. 2017)]SHG19616.1 hypothetical protein SAMN05444424_1829 [Bittarella massiliensis (ex Durand et al. 2017)]
MKERPALASRPDSATFQRYYYCKEELMAFCRANGLPASGGKAALTERVAHFLDTGEIPPPPPAPRRAAATAPPREDAVIGPNAACTQARRAFFQGQLGPSFTFNVAFQRWLKANPNKTYREAVAAYRAILTAKRERPAPIDSQFEYNAYVRAFFADNPGRTLQEAIACWNYKKQFPGSRQYQRADLAALEGRSR